MKCTELGLSPTMRPGVMQRGSGGAEKVSWLTWIVSEFYTSRYDRWSPALISADRPLAASRTRPLYLRNPTGLLRCGEHVGHRGVWAYVNPRVVPTPPEFEPPRTSPCCAIRLRLWIALLRGLPSSAMSWACLSAPPCLRCRVRNKASLRRVCETRHANHLQAAGYCRLRHAAIGRVGQPADRSSEPVCSVSCRPSRSFSMVKL